MAVIENLEATFFSQEYFDYLKSLDDIIACRSLKAFKDLNLPAESDAIKRIFASANHVPVAVEVMTAARAEALFKQLKPVMASSTFI